MSVPADRWPEAEPALYRRVRERDDPSVLATVVSVAGSAYRRPGAKMLVDPGDETVGSITVGCLRDRIVEAAIAVRETATPRVVAFDLADDDTWDLASGCDGRIKVLLEPVGETIRNALGAVADRRAVTVVTAVESTDPGVEVGDRSVIGDGTLPETGTGETLPAHVSEAVEVQSAETTATRTVETPDGEVTVLVDPIEPAPRLLLFGSRPDLRPIAWLGRAVGFEVVVASPRGGAATEETFPAAHEVLASHPTDLPEHTDRWTYPVVLSHNAIDDQLAVEALLADSSVPYVGLLGSRDRSRRLLEAIEDDGLELTDDRLDRLSTPVGLDLGGDGLTAVALSVVSEAHAVHHGGSGGRLGDRSGPIHERPQ
jgi:xanthine dehydrogenase accessory factor